MRFRIFAATLIGTVLLLIFAVARFQAISNPNRDFQAFWSAAHHLTDNPYQNIGMRNPPWVLPFVLPLRPFSYESAFGLWTAFTFIVVAGCGRVLWALQTKQPSLEPAFICLVFGPTLALISLGQLTSLVLLGLTLFLYFISQKKDLLAGASVLLILVKPHVSALFVLALLIWIVNSQRWRVLWSAALATAGSSILILAINSSIWREYALYAHDFTRTNQFFPTIGGVLIMVSGKRVFGLAPGMIGAVWVIIYFWRRRTTWNWVTDGPLVAVVSIVCNFYAFPYDEIVVLPALIAAAVHGNRKIFIPGLIIINTAYFVYLSNERFWKYGSPAWICWTSSAWLLLCILGSRKHSLDAESLASV